MDSIKKSPTDAFQEQNSVTLITIPEEIYDLLDPEKMEMADSSSPIGCINISGPEKIEIEINHNAYYHIKDGPNPDNIPLNYEAKVQDISHRNQFMYSQRETDFKIQTLLSLGANLVPTTLLNYNKYSTDVNDMYGSSKPKAIKVDISRDAEDAPKIFSNELTKSLIYGDVDGYKSKVNTDYEDPNFYNKKVTMDDTVLKQKIYKLYEEKDKYTMREICFKLGQTENRVKKALKQLCK